jgi:ABC-type Fe3+/spermidine/putrescine transport system ATPase subunit
LSKVEIKEVTKKFGKTIAISNLNISVAEGEFLSLVGPSGCGKTTTLRLIAGFIRPDKGQVFIGDRDMSHVGVKKRDVGIVFQNYALFPNMTASENVAFGMKARKMDEAVISKRSGELLEMVGLGAKTDSLPSQLSGGQQQRVALARALAIEPRVLLLDEPLSALDAKVRNMLRFEIKRIQQESGITTVYVTHDQEEALAISDRVALMNAGRIEQIGTPGQIYSRPATLFTANFVGVNNLISGDYMGEDIFRWAGGRVTVVQHDGLTPGEYNLSIRPEKLKIVRTSEKQVNVVKGICRGKVFLGPLVRLAVECSGEMFIVDLLNEDLQEITPGQDMELYFDPEDTLLLSEK